MKWKTGVLQLLLHQLYSFIYDLYMCFQWYLGITRLQSTPNIYKGNTKHKLRIDSNTIKKMFILCLPNIFNTSSFYDSNSPPKITFKMTVIIE